MARPWTWTISDTDGSNRRTMTLGQYLAEAKVAAKARGSTPSRDPAPSQEAEPWRDMKPNTLMLVAIGPNSQSSAAPRPSPLGWYTKAAGLVELSGNASFLERPR